MNHAFRHRLSGLYAITDASVTDPQQTIQAVEQALKGGARCIQFRDKSDKREQRLQACTIIRELTHQSNALFIINDDITLAKQVDADGVHLGQDDTDLVTAREQLGVNSVIGISCYNRLELAEKAVEQGADYIAFGRFFPSRTKPEAVKADAMLLQSARRQLDVPIVAIGGITLENAQELVMAGADMLAVVNGLFGQADVQAAAKSFSSLFD